MREPTVDAIPCNLGRRRPPHRVLHSVTSCEECAKIAPLQEVLPLAIDTLSRILASERLTHTILADNSSVLLNINGMRVLSLNETGCFLVEAIKRGARTEAQLAAALRREFEVDETTARRDVEQFLSVLERHLTV